MMQLPAAAQATPYTPGGFQYYTDVGSLSRFLRILMVGQTAGQAGR